MPEAKPLNKDLLLKRRADALAHSQAQEKTRNSGWHPADPGAEQREKAGQPALSARPIGLIDEETVHVVGPCVAVLREAAGAFAAAFDAEREKVLAVAAAADREPPAVAPDVRHAVKVARAVAAGADDVLSLDTRAWNGLMMAATARGLHVITTDAWF